MTKDRKIADTSARSPLDAIEAWGMIGGNDHRLAGYAPTREAAVAMAKTSTSCNDLGQRAARLRIQRDMTVADLAERAGVTIEEVEAFERGDITEVSTMLAVHHVLSGDVALDELFTTPRFESIADVVAYEARRRRT